MIGKASWPGFQLEERLLGEREGQVFNIYGIYPCVSMGKCNNIKGLGKK
jgi:hypothetical protein